MPVAVRKDAGFELHRVQCGLEPTDWKPVKTVGKGVREIRIQHRGQYHVIYVDVSDRGVYVLHAFVKKTRQTSKADIALAKDRLKSI